MLFVLEICWILLAVVQLQHAFTYIVIKGYRYSIKGFRVWVKVQRHMLAVCDLEVVI